MKITREPGETGLTCEGVRCTLEGLEPRPAANPKIRQVLGARQRLAEPGSG